MGTINDRLMQMKNDHWLAIVAPTIEYIVTGVSLAGILKNKTIRIYYKDGSMKERIADDSILTRNEYDVPTFPELVSFVQDGRSKKE